MQQYLLILKVRKSAPNLKDTHYGVSPQYPKEILEKRRKLVPLMKAAKSRNQKAYISWDKLYIDGKLHEITAETQGADGPSPDAGGSI